MPDDRGRPECRAAFIAALELGFESLISSFTGTSA
jgi:hypothetical protein